MGLLRIGRPKPPPVPGPRESLPPRKKTPWSLAKPPGEAVAIPRPARRTAGAIPRGGWRPGDLGGSEHPTTARPPRQSPRQLSGHAAERAKEIFLWAPLPLGLSAPGGRARGLEWREAGPRGDQGVLSTPRLPPRAHRPLRHRPFLAPFAGINPGRPAWPDAAAAEFESVGARSPSNPAMPDPAPIPFLFAPANANRKRMGPARRGGAAVFQRW